MKDARITTQTRAKEIVRAWHQIDVKGQTVGRVATQIAKLLMGKAKPYFVKNLDCGDYVVVTNAAAILVTGKKDSQKLYTSYSGYPGGLRVEAFKDLQERNPEEIVRRAVLGMLPKNKLRDLMMKRLYISKDETHDYKDKFSKAA
jgi:large subunit ribosomal protein L13